MDFVVASAVERSASEYIMTRSMVEGVGSWKARARKIQSPPTEGGGQKKR